MSMKCHDPAFVLLCLNFRSRRDEWSCIFDSLPPIYSVRVAVV